jgi:SET domain-containing protein
MNRGTVFKSKIRKARAIIECLSSHHSDTEWNCDFPNGCTSGKTGDLAETSAETKIKHGKRVTAFKSSFLDKFDERRDRYLPDEAISKPSQRLECPGRTEGEAFQRRILKGIGRYQLDRVRDMKTSSRVPDFPVVNPDDNPCKSMGHDRFGDFL